MNIPVNTDNFSGDVIRPFQLESSSLRGRIVRFGTVLDEILNAHDYPEVVSRLLAETITLGSLLASMLKFEGIFTLQTSGDGPVSMLVVDMTSTGDIRACASFDAEKIKTFDKVEFLDITQLLGKGYIAFTVDQGDKTDRYQGIVELKGETLTESVQHYFFQSEQIETGMMIAVGKRKGKWRAAGMMLQQMPSDGGNNAPEKKIDEATQDDWRRAMILMKSCTDNELLSPDLNSHDILIRLFHEEGVRVFEPIPLQHKCRCSQNKVTNIYKMLNEEEREDMIIDGKITLTCEFCSREFELDPKDFLNEK